MRRLRGLRRWRQSYVGKPRIARLDGLKGVHLMTTTKGV